MGIASYIINKVLPVQITKIQRTLAFSTTTPLGANAVYTSPTIDMINYAKYTGLVTSDQAGNLNFQHSHDGITWQNQSTTGTALAAAAITLSTGAPYFRYVRVIFTNGATAQTTFNLGYYLFPL